MQSVYKRYLESFKQISFFIFLSSTPFLAVSQEQADAYLFNSFKNYTKLPREVAFSHLNKSTLITGETLGFTVYIFDKYFKKPSAVTTNLYCSIENQSGDIIKKSLLLVKNGVAHGSFEIDSLFKSGNFVFKSYTNWMKNFEEQNFYVQNIKVINPEDHDPKSDLKLRDKIDAQFLPEGGHFIANIENSMGVVVKNNLGYGIPNLAGMIYDNNGTEITNFKTNAFGLAKFNITPTDQTRYTVRFENSANEEVMLNPAEAKGLSLKLTDLNDRIAVSLKTNTSTLAEIKQKLFKLSIHNGNQLKVIDVKFEDRLEVLKLIRYEDLYKGINILTVFNEKNQPLLERLFFKYNGIDLIRPSAVKLKKERDSVSITIPFETAIDTSKFNNLSVSVLPAKTKSYNVHQNIISKTYLQPYVQGFVENAMYYFTKIDLQKKSELDLLLVTQGWSSYDWTTVFNKAPENRFAFESGIEFIANIQNSKAVKIVVHPMINSSTIMLDIEPDQENFEVKGLYPEDAEPIRIGAFNKRNKTISSNLYLQFSPSKIPTLDKDIKSFPTTNIVPFDNTRSEINLMASAQNPEILDEVLITAKVEEERLEKISRRHKGRADIFDDIQRYAYPDFASYINSKGFVVNQDANNFYITVPRAITLQDEIEPRTPLVYLDNLLLYDFDILLNFDMTAVDYIIIDKSGLGEGMRGAAGVIKIFTDPLLRIINTDADNVSQLIDIPLTFTSPKTFYSPKYTNYKSDFYQSYGVIDWKPNLKVDHNGNASFKIFDTGNENLKLFIEGTANDGSFISEELTIDMN
ncbi:hypothetical protein ESY86_02990 [Subsaximicrobium wynnwilliamsii]|uniref:TonB-dependent receptor plug domain-containing protein n=1 Tax=Subsaximicrobium wynnwilliamsii TaxID=291179 RepID=A0A5C6ZM11_9FLAO|nr:hypothetical protein [Subsaximicrobium wynnwilliamsii]TXD85583.1 hypothetical protein ESY87_01300 [Subsaximicrobium wynnwilliamsii]TXD90935.1 hypothetical protein ESY86_02990 [Subsaximicrobium wynnwilliamsii]TXE05443.1 hypothetical protein ESY88_01300 [Subsaximicrobium wynnwilliamsii]